MSEHHSILNPREPELVTDAAPDVLAALTKTLMGFLPYGSLFTELIGSIIPGQKIDRVAEFVHVLSYRLSLLEGRCEKGLLTSPEFADLFEDSLRQASRSTSHERLEHIATLLTNSLTDEDVDHAGQKRLLEILDQLNDAEIIWLKSYTFRLPSFADSDYKTFYDMHRAVLEATPPGVNYHWGEPVEVRNRKALAEAYLINLARLGLLREKLDVPEEDIVRTSHWDKDLRPTGAQVISGGYSITRLGTLFLEYLDHPTT